MHVKVCFDRIVAVHGGDMVTSGPLPFSQKPKSDPRSSLHKLNTSAKDT